MFHSAPTGINFDTYDDIPVEATGENVPRSIGTVNIFDNYKINMTVFKMMKLEIHSANHLSSILLKKELNMKIFAPIPLILKAEIFVHLLKNSSY